VKSDLEESEAQRKSSKRHFVAKERFKDPDGCRERLKVQMVTGTKAQADTFDSAQYRLLAPVFVRVDICLRQNT